LIPAQPHLSDGGMMDDAIGTRFALLGRIPPGLADQAAALGAVRIEDPAVAGLLAEAGAEGLILRPDRIVLGAAEDPATAGLLRSLTGPLLRTAARGAG